MAYRFYYREIFKCDVFADSFEEAEEFLSSKDPCFGIDPLDYDDFDIIEDEDAYI